MTTITSWHFKDTVFSMDTDSAPGPDGLTACFYQKPWQIIARDLHKAIISFFEGDNLPKSFTHIFLVLIPKIEHPQKFSDLSPISLCNVSCKIISKLLNAALPLFFLGSFLRTKVILFEGAPSQRIFFSHKRLLMISRNPIEGRTL